MARGYWLGPGFWNGVAIAVMLAAGSGPAGAQAPASGTSPPPPPSGPVYRITYFDVAQAAGVKTAGLLRQFAAATRKEEGNTGFLALSEIARPGRFAVVEVWRDRAAAEAHAANSALRDQLQPWFASPFDIRSNAGLAVTPPPIGGEAGAGSATVYVLTHIDVGPPNKDQTVEMLKILAEDSRKDPGNLRFDILQQDGRLNHLPIIEAWSSAGAQAAHTMAEHTRAYRAKLLTMQGALYDERLYKAIR
jgi:autoinducer 2-degrading protein